MTTGLGILVIIGLGLILEGWAIMNKKPHDTISETIWKISFRFPFIPFLAGFLCGHLFWPSSTTIDWLR